MRIYIAGKITGDPNAKRNFEAAQAELQKSGHEPISPYKVGESLPELEHEEYMHISFALIDISEAVYFLANWKQSPGACMEYGYAIAKGKALYFQEEA